ncbi:MAG: replication-associated recombination protein A [Candidatus Jacksonbacteria bacterium]
MSQIQPLADRMRPKQLKDAIGQENIIGLNSVLAQSLKSGHLPSIIFWGPPGCGKTTIARLLAQEIKADFLSLQAVTSGLKEFRKIINQALENKIYEKKTVLFIDEIHRWNKKQQDALLPYVENGTIVFIGATTENPSFEVISALLSRVKVIILEPLAREQIVAMLKRALSQDDEIARQMVKINDKELEMIADFSGGDARIALNALELCVNSCQTACFTITTDLIKQIFDRTNLLYDKQGEEHYNIISAFIKSMRGSNADAAVYYLARMIEGGEKPEFIARRMLIFASEDIGNALPTALVLANACFDAVHKVGWPESQLILSQTAIYLAKAPKSNMVKRAINSAVAEVRQSGNLPVPLHLRNPETKLMKDLGYGQNYIYTHDDPLASQEFLPEKLCNKKFVK